MTFWRIFNAIIKYNADEMFKKIKRKYRLLKKQKKFQIWKTGITYRNWEKI